MKVTIDDQPNALVIISAGNVRDGEPRWYSPSREQAARDIADKNVGADLHTMTREECGIDDDSCPVAIVSRPLTDDPAPSMVGGRPSRAEVEAAVDHAAVLAELGATPATGNVRVLALPCDDGYVVNVTAVGVVSEAAARRLVDGHRRFVAVLERAKDAEAQTARAAIADATDGSPVGWRRLDSNKEGT